MSYSERDENWIGFALVLTVMGFIVGVVVGTKLGNMSKDAEYRRGQCAEVCASSRTLTVMPDHACRCYGSDALLHPKSKVDP